MYSCVDKVDQQGWKRCYPYVCGRDYQGRTLMVMNVGNESYKNARTLWRE
jgi:hypothetical protein